MNGKAPGTGSGGGSWDAIVVGSGFGGAMAAHALVHAGRRVLLLERGDWVERGPANWRAEGGAIVADKAASGGKTASIFAIAEPLSRLRPLYVNHAHNEYIELAVGGGLAAVVLLTSFVAWLAVHSLAMLRDRGSTTGLQGAAALCLWLIALQSLVEFSLRDACMSVILYQYEKVNPTSWAYLSSLLMLALFSKFNRIFSLALGVNLMLKYD